MRDSDIVLTDEEQALFLSIKFNWQNHDELRCSIEPMQLLAASLFERSAIPEIRIAYFTDPNFNPGERGKSREEIFEGNGISGDEILRHPHFLKHLEYFLCGPKLPSVAIDTFKKEALSSGYLTGGDINDLTPFARSCVRSNRLDPHVAADEFFKLAIECGAGPSYADTIRKSVRTIKQR
ncbi:hypothetical protein GE543_24810 [Pseudomonas sp. SZ57]|jgi:hypothetical protein|uniref:Uncharacterized protein n=1 Tax=Pseudomonas syringae pv. syringae TaxID=321 RepID=A0AB35JTE6_PSESY|nr:MULTISPECIES: hypothetical protein [Pseudomonas]MBC8802650.1 hypothetical protein [Pseudomonas congelans]MBP1147156.1 hypothetical protein [Pseudomonas sp. PvP027]MDC3738139.1 hypothetical protein [Pseudomonas syringae pv. syringae]MQQ37460.1 hypothetical protein [Pseudomonas sp. SZ57]